MPLYKNISAVDSSIALWRIEEELSYFESKFHSHPDIKNENKRLQWYATRHLVNQLLGDHVSMIKDEMGKPSIKNSTNHISLSHTPVFAAVMFSQKFPVGVDLEMITPKVERIAHKFLREDEISSIRPDEKIEKLILYWSAKESLFKLHGKGDIEFKTQLLIDPFELSLSGTLQAEISAGDLTHKNLTIQYEFFEDHVLTYVVGR
ncbi:MAG: 4'-phosphopantetheinyl transferase superfamily protein [Bacteroidota bacterium]